MRRQSRRHTAVFAATTLGALLVACSSPELAQDPATQPTEAPDQTGPGTLDDGQDPGDDSVGDELPVVLHLRDVEDSRDPFAPVRERPAAGEATTGSSTTAEEPTQPSPPPSEPPAAAAPPNEQPEGCAGTADGCTDLVRLLELRPPFALLQFETHLYEVEVGDSFGPGLRLLELDDECVVIADDAGTVRLCVQPDEAGLK